MPQKPQQEYAFHIPKFGEVDPQVIGEFIDELIDAKNEFVTPDDLVTAGRKANSPLRECFTYDDALAADKWRKKEAKDLIKNLHTAKNGKVTRTQAFEYVNHPDHGGKRVILSHRSAVARPEMREQLEERGVRKLQKDLGHFIDMFGSSPGLRALAKDAKKLKLRVQRELLQSV